MYKQNKYFRYYWKCEISKSKVTFRADTFDLYYQLKFITDMLIMKSCTLIILIIFLCLFLSCLHGKYSFACKIIAHIIIIIWLISISFNYFIERYSNNQYVHQSFVLADGLVFFFGFDFYMNVSSISGRHIAGYAYKRATAGII